MFEYTEENFLVPGVVRCTENQFRDEFIYRLDKYVGHGPRGLRWNEYCDFIGFVKKQKLRHPFLVWIFGSVVGNYGDPKDIDVILFFDKRDMPNIQSPLVDAFIISNAKVVFNVDCSHVFSIPETNEEKQLVELMKNDLPGVSKDRKHKRGIVEIIY